MQIVFVYVRHLQEAKVLGTHANHQILGSLSASSPLPSCLGLYCLESHEQRSLADYSPGGRKESDMTEGLLLLLLLSRFSRVRLCATPETAAHQAPPSLGFSRQEHWSETFSFLLQLAAEREALILQCCYHYTHSIWPPSLPLPVPTHFVCIQWDGQVDKGH